MEKKTKLQTALEYIDRDDMNPYAAAAKAGIVAGHVYAALKRRRMRDAGVCPCCGQPIKQTLDTDKEI